MTRDGWLLLPAKWVRGYGLTLDEARKCAFEMMTVDGHTVDDVAGCVLSQMKGSATDAMVRLGGISAELARWEEAARTGVVPVAGA